MRPYVFQDKPIEYVTNSIKGVGIRGSPIDVTWQSPVSRGKTVKQAAVSGQFHNPTSYFSEEVSVTEDSPRVTFYSHVLPWEVREITTRSTHISPLLPDPNFLAFPPGYSVALQNALDKSVTKALNNLRQKDSMELGASVAESKKSAEMMADSAKQLWEALIAAKKGRWGEVPGHLGMDPRSVLYGRYPANKWLEYQYGWKPLVKDAYQFYQRLYNHSQDGHTIFGISEPVVSHTEHYPGYYDVTWTCKGGARTVLAATIGNGIVREMDSYGLLNPLSIAWELTPFSFAIDWGIPIGNVLSALTATAGLDFAWGYSSLLGSGNYSVTTPISNEPWFETVLNPGRFSVEKVRFDRTLLGSFPLPRLYGNQNPFSTPRILNALAVGRTLFTGRP